MEWIQANDIEQRLNKLIFSLGFSHIEPARIFCFRSFGSRSKARARIWSLPRIWQKALGARPAYCIEVLAEKFDKLTEEAKNKVLIHELLHIPRNFSGSLLSHKGRNRRIDSRIVNKFYQTLKENGSLNSYL